MLENKKEDRSGDRELSGRVDWIIAPSSSLLCNAMWLCWASLTVDIDIELGHGIHF